jgi:hypothetical protein
MGVTFFPKLPKNKDPGKTYTTFTQHLKLLAIFCQIKRLL